MKDLIKLGLILMTIASIAAAALSLTNQITSPRIEEYKRAEERRALGEVLPEATEFKEVQRDGYTFREGYKDGQVVGVAVTVTVPGYGGDIYMMVGIDRSYRIAGVKVLSHSETPGLGARITEIRRGEERPWFLGQFRGKHRDQLFLKRDNGAIDAITAATISSRAVTEGVREALELYLKLFVETQGVEN